MVLNYFRIFSCWGILLWIWICIKRRVASTARISGLWCAASNLSTEKLKARWKSRKSVIRWMCFLFLIGIVKRIFWEQIEVAVRYRWNCWPCMHLNYDFRVINLVTTWKLKTLTIEKSRNDTQNSGLQRNQLSLHFHAWSNSTFDACTLSMNFRWRHLCRDDTRSAHVCIICHLLYSRVHITDALQK